MLKILLVTTSTNAVWMALEQELGNELITIDCALSKSVFFQLLDNLFQRMVPDILITYRCPYILPERIFQKARLGAFNIHPSLLPKYPGLNPWNDMFLNHEREGGVTLHQITGNVDAGPILFQSSFLIDDTDTIDSARMKADQHAVELVNMLIRNCKK